jgi:hypothetical protein
MFVRNGFVVSAVAVLSLLGVVAALYATQLGAGAFPDSLVYLRAANNLLEDRGLTYASPGDGMQTPLVYFPPLYSAVLAAIGLFGADLWSAARWLNAILFGANIFLVGFTINRMARARAAAPVPVSLLMLASLTMLRVHSAALTEPMFIFLAFAGLFTLAKHIENSRPLFLASAAGLAALAFLTRYVGLALVIAGIPAILFLGKSALRVKIRNSVIFGAVSVLPMAAWMLRNLLLTHSATQRSLAYHAITRYQLREAVKTFAYWLLPLTVPGALKLTFLVFCFAGIALLLRRGGRPLRERIASIPSFANVLVIFIVAYSVFLLVSKCFFDAATPLDYRLLSPVFVAALTVAALLLPRLASAAPGVRLIPSALCLLAIVAVYLFSAADFLDKSHREGQGYAARAWRDSPLVARLKALPGGLLVFSNDPDAIDYLTGRPAVWLPNKIDTLTRRPNDGYEPELAEMGEQLKKRAAVIVYFSAIGHTFVPTQQELLDRFSLRAVAQEQDGVIYETAATAGD